MSLRSLRRRGIGTVFGVLILGLAAAGQAWSAAAVPETGEFAAAASARSLSVVFLRQGFVIPNPVDLHFGSAVTRLDGGPGYGAVADAVDPGFVKRAGGVAATVGVPVVIPDWPLGVELETGGEGGANQPISVSSPDGSVSVDAIPAHAIASRGPGTRVDADAAVESVRIGIPDDGTKSRAITESGAPSLNTVASATLRASTVLKELSAWHGAPIGNDGESKGRLLSLATATAKSGSGWFDDRLEATAAAQVSGIELLDGTIKFDAVRSAAVARTGLDGKPSEDASVAVAGARIAEIPVTVDAGGVHVDKQAVSKDAVSGLQDALDSALEQAGVRIGLLELKASGGVNRAVGLEVVVPLTNAQLRENNELAFRFATVETSSTLDPESITAPEELATADAGPATADTAAPTMTPSVWTATGAAEQSGPSATAHVPAGTEPVPGIGSRDHAIGGLESSHDPASKSGLEPHGGQSSNVGDTPAEDHRQVELFQHAAAHDAQNEKQPLSKGEASLLLIALAGQAAFVVLLALRRFSFE
jgi:hypothetical protein